MSEGLNSLWSAALLGPDERRRTLGCLDQATGMLDTTTYHLSPRVLACLQLLEELLIL